MKHIDRIIFGQMLIKSSIVLLVVTIMSCTQNNGPTFTVDLSKPGAVVADICRGQQIEEFNHQFEGGLYARLIKNASFEELIRETNTLKNNFNTHCTLKLY